MLERLTLAIEDYSSLATASRILHDAVFRQQEIYFNCAEKTFTLRLWREVRECRRLRRVCFILPKIEYLRALCTLTFCEVESATIRIWEKLAYHHLFSLTYDLKNHTLNFETEGCINIILQTRKLTGILTDTGEITWEQFGYFDLLLFPWWLAFCSVKFLVSIIERFFSV